MKGMYAGCFLLSASGAFSMNNSKQVAEETDYVKVHVREVSKRNLYSEVGYRNKICIFGSEGDRVPGFSWMQSLPSDLTDLKFEGLFVDGTGFSRFSNKLSNVKKLSFYKTKFFHNCLRDDFLQNILKGRHLLTVSFRECGIESIEGVGMRGSAVETVTLSNNNIQVLNDGFLYWKTVERLDLSHNQLVFLPQKPDMRDETVYTIYSSLKELNLSHNNLLGLPARKMLNLEKLDVSYNQLDAWPEEASTNQIYSEYASRVGICGGCLRELTMTKQLYPKLKELNIYRSGLKSLPEDLWGLDSLEKVTFEKDLYKKDKLPKHIIIKDSDSKVTIKLTK